MGCAHSSEALQRGTGNSLKRLLLLLKAIQYNPHHCTSFIPCPPCRPHRFGFHISPSHVPLQIIDSLPSSSLVLHPTKCPVLFTPPTLRTPRIYNSPVFKPAPPPSWFSTSYLIQKRKATRRDNWGDAARISGSHQKREEAWDRSSLEPSEEA